MMQNSQTFSEELITDSLYLDLYSNLIHVDNEGKLRKSLTKAKGMTASFLLKYVKSCMGADLSTITAPVNFNEACTVLQKTAEMAISNTGYEEAAKQEDSLMRMVYVATGVIQGFAQVVGRTSKPFNPMLGETYEYVTKDIKFYSETVSHHPPIFALNVQTDKYETNRVC
jgi:hypothetical protein